MIYSYYMLDKNTLDIDNIQVFKDISTVNCIICNNYSQAIRVQYYYNEIMQQYILQFINNKCNTCNKP